MFPTVFHSPCMDMIDCFKLDYEHREENQLDATECFIALIKCSALMHLYLLKAFSNI